jgi:hypothetical protein
MRRRHGKIKSTLVCAVGRRRQSATSNLASAGSAVLECAVAGRRGGYPAARMNEYANPYQDDPEAAPLTRTGRLTECALVVLLTFLAVYLSR